MVQSKQRARELFWWPKMDAEVERVLKSCEVYATLDKTARARSTQIQPVPLPEAALDKIGRFHERHALSYHDINDLGVCNSV